MADKTCDLNELRSLGMIKTQSKMRELRTAGIPVSGEVFGDLVRISYAEAKAECLPVSYEELTEKQLELLTKICPVCVDRFKAKEALTEQVPAEVLQEAVEEK